MKNITKILIATMIITLLFASLTACKKDPTGIDIPLKGLGSAPSPDYQEATYDISEMNALNNDIDKAILLFTYASYNQVDAPYFYFYAVGEGDTIVGSMLSQSVRVQVGYNYFHQVISKVVEVKSAAINPFLSIVERAKRRVNYNSLQYRYDGKNLTYDEANDTLLAAWKDPGSGNAYTPEKGDYNTLSNVDFSDRNAISSATITTVNANGRAFYKVNMVTNVAVVNASEYSMEKLRSDTSADPVSYREYSIEFEVWDSGYFRSINYLESWEGKIVIFSGSSESTNYYLYSYDIDDCDINAYIEMAGIPLANE
ncbi:MAG: hypothetical protein EOM87_02865 [Clostridia bacterium]|nr:hypothetical protein [Clostridia bacterium]